MSMIHELVVLTLAGIHFGVPLGYYSYLKRKWLRRSWNIKVDERFRAKLTVMIPTYNEADIIRAKLDNLYSQEYPRPLVEAIVIDSASEDGTAAIVEEWSREHSDMSLSLIKDRERRGMVPSLNQALKSCPISGNIVLFTDADAIWNSCALRDTVKYFADPNVGAVTTSVVPVDRASERTEAAYRGFYNTVRVAESKIHSTPVHNAQGLVAFRTLILHAMGALPTYTGNNDSTPASITAFMGYRAIQIDDEVFRERMGQQHRFLKKVRRAQHLILSFLITKSYTKERGLYRKSAFNRVWRIEWYLHVANPWFLATSAAILVVDLLVSKSLGALALSVLSLLLLGSGTFRMWVTEQVYLIVALFRNLWTRDIAWTK